MPSILKGSQDFFYIVQKGGGFYKNKKKFWVTFVIALFHLKQSITSHLQKSGHEVG